MALTKISSYLIIIIFIDWEIYILYFKYWLWIFFVEKFAVSHNSIQKASYSITDQNFSIFKPIDQCL